MNVAETIAANSPTPWKLRRFDEYGDHLITLFRRVVNAEQSAEAAIDELTQIVAAAEKAQPQPTKWAALIHGVGFVFRSITDAKNEDQRRQIGASAVEYFNWLRHEIATEEAEREGEVGVDVALEGLSGGAYAQRVLNATTYAETHGLYLNFQK